MEKFFDQDKNYILKQAQYDLKNVALNKMVSIAIEEYLFKHNPLGLIDDFVLTLQQCENPDIGFLYKPYQLLSAVYRLLHSDNQLTFLWDGRSHHEVFTNQWDEVFTKWMHEFCSTTYMDRIIIKGAIINPASNTTMLEAHLMKLIYQRFPVKKSKKGTLIAA
jgi:hypothetical protein